MENRDITASTAADPTPPSFTWKWLDLFWIILGIGLIFLLCSFILGVVLARGTISPDKAVQPSVSLSLGLAATESLAIIAGIYYFGIRRRKNGWESVGLRPVSPLWLIVSGVITVFAIPLSGLITILVMLALGQPLVNPQLDFLLPEGFSLSSALIMVLLAGVTAPFAEELFFRGVLYTFFKERWGIWPAVFSSSILFGVLHGDIAVGVTAFVLGIILALVFEYSRSLWAAVLVHVINNSVKILLLYILVALGFSGGS